MDKKLISIVVPCYNEELTVEKFYSEAVSVFNGYKHEIEIIFVDDGSHDKTFEIINKLSKKISQTRILKWLAIPSPGDLPDPGTEPRSPAPQADSLPTEL